MKIYEWIRNVTFLTLLLVVAIAGAPTAAASEKGWNVRVQGVYMDSSLNDRTNTSDGVPVDISTDSDTGLGIDFGRRVSDYVGWEIGILQASPSMNLTTDFGLGGAKSTFSRNLRTRAITAALDFHLTPNRVVDLYLSPMIASVYYGSLSYSVDTPDGTAQSLEVDVDRHFGWGLGLGMDIPFGNDAWRATGSIRYLDSELDIREVDGDFTDALNFDMTIVSLGIIYRF